MKVTLGRRVAGPEDLQRPGDYAGPLEEVGGPDLEPTGRTAVWLVPPDGSAPVRLPSPPWQFLELADGSLEITSPSPAPLIPSA